MKNLKLTLALLASLAVASFITTASAAEDKGKEMTVTGTALCAKCALHQSDKCETVVKTTVDGKDVMYHLTGKEAKVFHEKICDKTDGEKVTVTGNVTGKDGKEMMHVTKIEEVKETK